MKIRQALKTKRGHGPQDAQLCFFNICFGIMKHTHICFCFFFPRHSLHHSWKTHRNVNSLELKVPPKITIWWNIFSVVSQKRPLKGLVRSAILFTKITPWPQNSTSHEKHSYLSCWAVTKHYLLQLAVILTAAADVCASCQGQQEGDNREHLAEPDNPKTVPLEFADSAGAESEQVHELWFQRRRGECWLSYPSTGCEAWYYGCFSIPWYPAWNL